jgi:Ca2+-binding RTX toxin-like protein
MPMIKDERCPARIPRSPMRIQLIMSAMTAILAFGVPAAGAATLTYTTLPNGTASVTIVTDQNEGHDITVEWSADGMVVTDRDSPFRSADGCEMQGGNPHIIDCGPTASIYVDLSLPDGHTVADRVRIDTATTATWHPTEIQVHTGSFDDQIDLSHADVDHAMVTAGAGNDDVYAARSGTTEIYDEAGDDILHGGGQDSQTTFWAGEGADTYIGGPGQDFVDYQLHGSTVHATRDGQANDGNPGEHDNIGSGIDRILGTPGPDVVTARGKAGMLLEGFIGSDLIIGGPGDDTLDPGPGYDSSMPASRNTPDADILRGGGGIDTVSYAGRWRANSAGLSGVRISEDGKANDGDPDEHDNIADDVEILEGTQFNDIIRGGPANNTLIGGAGNDKIYARGGGRDIVSCGSGYDLAVVDKTDQVGGDCEVVKVK